MVRQAGNDYVETMSGNATQAVAAATRIRVRPPGHASPVFETSDAAEIRAFAATLATKPSTTAFCVCAGTLLVELENCAIERLELHHGDSIRWDGSNGNLELVAPSDSMDWLSRRGMSIVRESFDASHAAEVQALDVGARWMAALPASLRPFFHEMRQSSELRSEWSAALATEIPDAVRRAEVLLELYASGAGPWSGYPSWERVPEQLLAETSIATLLDAIGIAPNAMRARGTLRLLSSRTFRERKRDLRKKLSPAVRDLLRAHALALEEHDDRDLALSALGLSSP